jgi:hypothetical protein
LNFDNCICSIERKSFGLVLILIPGNSRSLKKPFRLAACFITFSASLIWSDETSIVAPLQL